MSKAITLKTLVQAAACTLSLGLSSAWGAGNTLHIMMSERAIGYVQSADLRNLLNANKSQWVMGTALPDGGYANGDPYAETAHWPPFHQAYFDQVKSRCGASTAGSCGALIAHFMGMAAHGIEDEVYDLLFLDRSNWLEGAGGDGLSSKDYIVDVYALWDNDRSSFIPSAVSPLDDVYAAFQRMGATNVSRDSISKGEDTMIAAAIGERASYWATYLATKDSYPWMRRYYMQAPGAVDYTAKTVAKLWDYYWARLRDQNPPANLTAFVPQDAALELNPSDSWSRFTVIADRPIKGDTATNNNFYVVDQNGNRISGYTSTRSDSYVMRFMPSQALSPGAKYTAVVTSAVRDRSGNALTPDGYSWTVMAEPAQRVTLRSWNGYYFRALNAGGEGVKVDVTEPRSHERHELLPLGGNQYALRAPEGQYLRANAGGGSGIFFDTFHVLGHERYRLIPLGGDRVALECANGSNWLQAQNGGGDVGQCQGPGPNSHETFRMTPVGELFGGDGGSFFNDETGLPFNGRVSRLILRAGADIDGIGIEYSNGARFYHGGSGGSEQSLSLATGEYLTQLTACKGGWDGKQIIRHVSATTNTGRSVSGGGNTGDCTTFNAPAGYQIAGFSGQSGSRIDRLAVIYQPQSRYYNWAANEPNNWGGAEHCAQMAGWSNGQWNDNSCNASWLYYACQSDSSPDSWTVSNQAGSWWQSGGKCPAGSSFAAPRNANQNAALKQAAGGRDVWLNLSDERAEGQWSGLP